MKKVIALLLAVFAALTLVACAPKEETAVGYRVVHKDYVGVVNLVVLDGVIQDVEIDEYYLPYTWAKVAVTGETAPADVVVVPGTTPAWYAKYIVIGDKQFTGVLRDAAYEADGVTYSKQMVKYSATGVDDLLVWLLADEANCEWYVEQLIAGKAFVAKDTFAVNTSLYTWNQGNGFTKSETGYWSGSSYPLGWVGNQAALAEAVEGKVFNPEATLVKATEDPKVWTIGDAVSGATMSDLPDYYKLIGIAYAKTGK
jgi:hypothetical protein